MRSRLALLSGLLNLSKVTGDSSRDGIPPVLRKKVRPYMKRGATLPGDADLSYHPPQPQT